MRRKIALLVIVMSASSAFAGYFSTGGVIVADSATVVTGSQSNIIASAITNGGATINGSPITNGASFTITGGGSGGGISNISVAGVSGTLTGSGSNLLASVSLASLAGAGVTTNGQKLAAATNSDWAAWAASATNAVTVTGPQSNTIATALQPASTQGLATVTYVDAATNAAIIDTTNRVAGVGYLLPASTQNLATVAQVNAATNAIDSGFLASKGAVTNNGATINGSPITNGAAITISVTGGGADAASTNYFRNIANTTNWPGAVPDGNLQMNGKAVTNALYWQFPNGMIMSNGVANGTNAVVFNFTTTNYFLLLP